MTTKQLLVLYTLDGKPKLFTGDKDVWETQSAGATAKGERVEVKMQTSIKDITDHGTASISCDLTTWMGDGFTIAAPIDPADTFETQLFRSSVLAWGAYYEKTKRLRLTFNSGRQYDYAPVGNIVWDSIKDTAVNGGSVGKLYNQIVKGTYDVLFITDKADLVCPSPTTLHLSLSSVATVHVIPQGDEFDARLANMRVSLKNASLLIEMQSAYKRVCALARNFAGK